MRAVRACVSNKSEFLSEKFICIIGLYIKPQMAVCYIAVILNDTKDWGLKSKSPCINSLKQKNITLYILNIHK